MFEGTWGLISAGSAPGLRRELAHLATILTDRLRRAIRSADDDESDEFDALTEPTELCERLLDATHESLTLRLPLLLRG
jgi:hypothetical protein